MLNRSFLKLITSKSDEDIKIHIEALKHKISQAENIKTSSANKMAYYNTIYLFLFPLLFLWIRTEKNSFLYVVLSSIFVYILLNIYLFIYEFFKVKGFLRFSFRELKASTDTLKQFAKSVYKDWYSSKEEKVIFVTYVKNVEKYIRYSMFLIGTVVLMLWAVNIKSFIEKKQIIPHSSTAYSKNIIPFL